MLAVGRSFEDSHTMNDGLLTQRLLINRGMYNWETSYRLEVKV